MKQSRLRMLSLAMGTFLLLAILAACGTGTTSTTSTAHMVIKVATDLPISGGEIDIGTSTMNGAELAVTQANTNQTIPNVTLQLIKKDDAGASGKPDGPTGAANITSLLDDPQVAGVVGPFNSAVAKAEMPVANTGGIALISPSNTNPCLTKDTADVECSGANDLIKTLRPTGKVTYFRLASTDDHQGPAMADYLYNTLHLKTVFVIDDTTTYGAGIAKYFARGWTRLGGTVIDGQSHSVATTTDYTNLLTEAAAKKPDVIYFGGDYDTGGQIIQKQMRTIPGLTNTVFSGGDGLSGSQDFYKQITDDGGQAYITVASPDPSKIPAAQQFIKDYTATYHASVGPYSPTAFDAMNVLIQAIKKALSTTPAAKNANDTAGGMAFRQAVINALKQTDYNGVTGHTTFDANGDTTNKIFTLGKVVLVNGTPTLQTQKVITVQ
jgi:branched-chain amino acid transport system substrate-binding protein